MSMSTQGSHPGHLEKRYTEHSKAPSLIYEHQNTTGHKTSVGYFTIKGWEGLNMAMTIKETVYIRVNKVTMNKNIGKYNLPHIWEKKVLHSDI